MSVASVMLGIGGDIRYIYYGRYFEFMLPIFTALTMYIIVYEREHILETRNFIVALVIIILLSWDSCYWFSNYTENTNMLVDTFRSPTLTGVITNSENIYDVMIKIMILGIVCCMLIYGSEKVNYIQKSAVLISLMICIIPASFYCEKNIREIHDKAYGDTQIAEYIIQNVKDEDIYMIDDNSYKYQYHYSRMQILLGKNKLNVITPEEYGKIRKGDYVIVYMTSQLNSSVLANSSHILDGQIFSLYRY